MRVADLMTKSPVSICCDQPLSEAARLMWDNDCGAVPVIEREGGPVVGMVTDRDICVATWSRDMPPSCIRASEVMSRELHYCTPQDSIGFAENLMRSKQIRRIPVVDTERRLLGMLSLADIARQGERAGNGIAPDGLGPEQIARTLASISQPQGTAAATNGRN